MEPEHSFQMMQIQGGKQELVISGLIPFTFYTIFVQAIGESGLNGPNSETITQRTTSAALTSVELKKNDLALESTTETITFKLPPIHFVTGPLK